MSRYIDADALTKEIKQDITDNGLTERYVFYRINDAPSIDIVFCKECKWSKANGTYQWCGRLDSTAQITADDFCSYGVKKGADDE